LENYIDIEFLKASGAIKKLAQEIDNEWDRVSINGDNTIALAEEIITITKKYYVFEHDYGDSITGMKKI